LPELEMKIGKLILTMQMLLFASSCYSVTPQENFKNILNNAVGRNVRDEENSPGGWLYTRQPITVTHLPNGNVEKKYLYMRGRSCYFFFETNPDTSIIISARFEGKESDCVINP
jgi:hypothetical protein